MATPLALLLTLAVNPMAIPALEEVTAAACPMPIPLEELKVDATSPNVTEPLPPLLVLVDVPKKTGSAGSSAENKSACTNLRKVAVVPNGSVALQGPAKKVLGGCALTTT
jgi:hypothetical protein